MGIKTRSCFLSAGAFAIVSALTGLQGQAQAADIASCQSGLAGTIGAGYILGELEFDFGKGSDSEDYGTFFGEGAALYHWCDSGINLQGDFAFHSHQFDVDGLSFDLSNDRWHAGGILFWRDQSIGLLGLDASFINDDFFGKNNETLRIGARAEYFLGDMFTLGAGAGYLNGEIFGTDADGFDANAWARFYATDSLGFLGRFDWSSRDVEAFDSDTDTWSITGEAEYLLPSLPASIFAGARYAETDFDDFSDEFQDTQVYAGLKVYFGSEGLSLSATQRSNTLDNTSVHLEKLPSHFSSVAE